MWFGWIVVSNPLAGWWDKNKKKAIIAGVAVVVLWAFLATRDRTETEAVAIPEGYASADRELLVHAPAEPDNPLPLVIVLHDNNSDASAIERESDASSLSDRRDFALAYPEAVGGTWRIDPPDDADVQYVRDVIRFMDSERTDVDLNRIYVWGIGEGARLALTVACSSADPRVAAVGVVGQFDPEPQPTCEDRVPHGRVLQTGWDDDVTDTLWEFSEDSQPAEA